MAGTEDVAAPSVAESLASAIENVQTPTGGSDGAAAPATETGGAPAPEGTPATSQATPTPGATGRTRDAAGRFAREGTPGAQPAPAAAPATAPAATPPATAPAATPDDAPVAWSPEAKGKWATVDPAVKAEINRREREVTIGLQRAAQSRQFGDSILQELTPYMDDIRNDGASPQEAIRQVFETIYMLRHGSAEHKRALALSLLQQYGITFDAPLDTGRARLEYELDSRRLGEQRNQAGAQHGIVAEATNAVEAFRNEAGHEHFETVRTVMAGLVREGQVATLQEAYDQACWAHPKVRPLLMQQQNVQRAADATARSRHAAAAVSGAPGAVNTAATPDPKNLRATIAAQMDGGGRI